MNVPKLRFGEFVENWNCKNLGDIAQFSKGKGIAKADISKDGQFECIRYGELYTHYKETIKQVISRTNLSADELVFSDANDVIIPASGETQLDIATASCVLKKGVALGGDLNIIKSDSNGVFLSYYLNNAKKQSIANLAQGISVVHLYASQLKTLELNIPEIEEQQKIADFLSAVDEKITALTAQKTALTQYKQGMMQRIFAQTLRFKDDNGADYPEWDHAVLGHICEPQQWQTISSNQLTESGYPVYGANGHIGFYSTFNHENEAIAVTCRGATCGNVHWIPAKSYITGNAMCLDGFDEKRIYSKFVYYALTYRGLTDMVSGSAQPQIIGKDIRRVDIRIPCLFEQTKIAQFLTELDDKINAVDAQIQSAQQWKQGLLQQMFV